MSMYRPMKSVEMLRTYFEQNKVDVKIHNQGYRNEHVSSHEKCNSLLNIL